MDAQVFKQRIAEVTAAIAGKPLDDSLADYLNAEVPADGEWFQAIEMACRQATVDGWMCQREQGGIRFGRVVAAGEATHGFSVDVVEMHDVVGPHHVHPNGEIDMIMPLQGNPEFDGCGKGWLVFPPGSAHRPTVTGGSARVLYLLPGGAIEFSA